MLKLLKKAIVFLIIFNSKLNLFKELFYHIFFLKTDLFFYNIIIYNGLVKI